jgi:hypothetical protein
MFNLGANPQQQQQARGAQGRTLRKAKRHK